MFSFQRKTCLLHSTSTADSTLSPNPLGWVGALHSQWSTARDIRVSLQGPSPGSQCNIYYRADQTPPPAQQPRRIQNSQDLGESGSQTGRQSSSSRKSEQQLRSPPVKLVFLALIIGIHQKKSSFT